MTKPDFHALRRSHWIHASSRGDTPILFSVHGICSTKRAIFVFALKQVAYTVQKCVG